MIAREHNLGTILRRHQLKEIERIPSYLKDVFNQAGQLVIESDTSQHLLGRNDYLGKPQPESAGVGVA